MTFRTALLGGLLAVLAATPALADGCEARVGVLMELTGPAGAYGQAGAKAVDLAFRDLNAAGCKLTTDIRDSQSQSTVAVDAAKQLVEVDHVPILIGGIISSVTIPVLTSVTAAAHVVQISPASSSPTLTTLARDGKTGGYFFRTIISDALQGVAAAKYAMDLGLKKLAVIRVNNDFGVNMAREFARSYLALGGVITSTTPYNERQSSYTAEAAAGMAGDPDGLYLVSYPADGATIARAWIAQGGSTKFLLNDGMNSADFIDSVGAKYLTQAYGTSSGTERTPSTEFFNKSFEPFAKLDPGSPAAVQSYDAGAIAGLAVAIASQPGAGKPDADAIKAAISKVVDPTGTDVYAGPEGFKQALSLVKAGKPIHYIGVIGPISFDQYGDITGPFRTWKIDGGKVVTTGQMSTAEVNKLRGQLGH